MAQKGWIIDIKRCVGCRACVVACKMENNTPTEVNYRWVVERETGEFPNPSVEFISVACNHCANPACLASCPVDAISKDGATGLVQIDSSLCIGCKKCMAACPYGAPQFNSASGKVEKCTYCKELLDNGVLPACARACIADAIRIGEDEAWGGTAPDGWASQTLTNPSVLFEP